jgi:hypothetical protein
VRQVEASQWRDGKLDQAKLDKMSGANAFRNSRPQS